MLRDDLDKKDFVLLYAYNGTGKTRLSMAFKEAGKKKTTRLMNCNDAVDQPLTIEEVQRDTLYFNAYTEDLFTWDNDLENDTQRVLRLNTESRFFAGLEELEMETRIRPFLHRYSDFDFSIDTDNWTVSFSREVMIRGRLETIDNIKVSRGEENIFVWCFFLAIAQLAIDKQGAYTWVKYLYIDDPISSLDDNNAIAVASHLAQLISNKESNIKVVLSSHHTLFYNVMWNEIRKANKYFLCKAEKREVYLLKDTGDTPFFHHVSMLVQLHRAATKGKLYTYHFNILRSILEKTASFHGFNNFSACIKQSDDDPEGVVHTRMINVLSHGNYSLFEPKFMVEDNRKDFIKILKNFMSNYQFNPELFPEPLSEDSVESN
jgi:hypothetical protein